MFDIAWSELLIVGIVALIVIGPKDLPIALRTVGKYMGLIRRQAAEFRAQFDEAMREAEMEQLKKEMGDIKSGLQDTMRDAERSFEAATSPAQPVAAPPASEVNGVGAHPDPMAHDADGIPIAPPATPAAIAAAAAAAHAVNGAAPPDGAPKSGA